MNSDGKMHPTSGNSILIGALAACSSARWRRSMRSCSDWTCSTLEIETPSCSAWMIAPMKLVSGDDLGPGDDVAQRVSTRLPDTDLGECPPELIGQRSLELLDDLREGSVEAETGSDGDRQKVEGVRDHQQDGLLARLDLAPEPELRRGVAEQRTDHRHEDAADDEREADESDDPEQDEEHDRADDRADGLDAEPVGDAQVARVAGQCQAFLRLLAERSAGDAGDAPRQAHGERAQGPFHERLLELELLEVLGLHRPELGQPGLDGIDRRAARQPDDDEEDGAGGEGRDDDRKDRHRL